MCALRTLGEVASPGSCHAGQGSTPLAGSRAPAGRRHARAAAASHRGLPWPAGHPTQGACRAHPTGSCGRRIRLRPNPGVNHLRKHASIRVSWASPPGLPQARRRPGEIPSGNQDRRPPPRGGMRFVARTGSGFEIAMDDEAGGTAPRPTELLASAIGGCTAMDVASILEKKRQVVTRYALRVEGVQRDAHPHAFRRVTITHEVEGPAVDVEAVRRAIELSATRYCSVSTGLASGYAAAPPPVRRDLARGRRPGRGRGRRHRSWPGAPARRGVATGRRAAGLVPAARGDSLAAVA